MMKLNSYCIHSKVLTWIRSFLIGRKQKVVITGCESIWTSVISGVPQGSVLGPVLFLIYIYINDIVENLSCNAYLFADDMKLFSGITSDLDINKLQTDINTISTWTDKWLLKLNAQKCKTMTVGKSHNDQTHTYQLDSQNLCTVTEEKDLGVLINNDL